MAERLYWEVFEHLIFGIAGLLLCAVSGNVVCGAGAEETDSGAWLRQEITPPSGKDK
jgi:hypothetical protein